MPEVRAVTSVARATGATGDQRVSGMGIVYDTWTEIYPGFRERINKGAVVKRATPVKSFFNHDPGMVLATTESDPPLELKETEAGIEYTTPIPPTSYGNDLAVNLARGNVRGSSFAFSVPRGGDRFWEDDKGVLHREISEYTLYELGPVVDPAYTTTTAALRSAQDAVAAWRAAQVPPSKSQRNRNRQKMAEMYC